MLHSILSLTLFADAAERRSFQASCSPSAALFLLHVSMGKVISPVVKQGDHELF